MYGRCANEMDGRHEGSTDAEKSSIDHGIYYKDIKIYVYMQTLCIEILISFLLLAHCTVARVAAAVN